MKKSKLYARVMDQNAKIERRKFEYLIIGLDIILVGILLFISTPLEKAPRNWTPDMMKTDPLEHGQSKETLLSSDDIEEGEEEEGLNNWEKLEPASSLEEESEDVGSVEVVVNEDAIKEEDEREKEEENTSSSTSSSLPDEVPPQSGKEVPPHPPPADYTDEETEVKDDDRTEKEEQPKKRSNFTVVATNRLTESPPQTRPRLDTAVIRLEFADSDSDSISSSTNLED